MSSTTRLTAALLLTGMTAPTALAQPKQNLTLPYPAKVPVVLQLNGPERVRERLAKMIGALPPAEATLIANQLDAGWKTAFAGRKLTAVPRDGRVFVVLHEFARLGEDTPPVSVLIPVTSYQEFRASFLTEAERKAFEAGNAGIDLVKTAATGNEVTVYLVDLKEYVALTLDKTVAEGYTAKYTRALSAGMGPELSASFLNADVSLYVNMDVVNETYGEDIRNMRALIEFALQQAGMNDTIPGLDKKQLDAAKTMIVGVFQGVEDCQGVVFAAELRAEGLNLRAQARFSADSPTSQLFRDERPSTLADLSRLPIGMNSYTGFFLSPRTTKLIESFNEAYAAAPGDEAGAQSIEHARAELRAAGSGVAFLANGTDGTVQVLGFKSPEKALAAEVKLFKSLAAGAKVNGVILKEKPKVVEGATTHRGITFAEVGVVMDFEATVAAMPEQGRGAAMAMFKRVGRERTTTWVGTDGKVVFHISAKDWSAAEKTLDAYLDGGNGVGSETGYRLTRKNLPADASAIMLFETQATIHLLLDYTRETFKALPADLPAIGKPKAIKTDPTYVGVALTLKPQSATLDLFVPTTSMNTAARMLVPLFKPVD